MSISGFEIEEQERKFGDLRGTYACTVDILRDEKQELREIIEAQKKEIRRLQREVQDLKRRNHKQR